MVESGELGGAAKEKKTCCWSLVTKKEKLLLAFTSKVGRNSLFSGNPTNMGFLKMASKWLLDS